jgi:hypothetical protein
LLILSAVTTYEQRFWTGTVWSPATIDGTPYRSIGMSFLGDPMVWGFAIVVPCLIGAIGVATRRTVVLVNTSAEIASAEWRADASELGFSAAVQRSKEIWHLQGLTGAEWRATLRWAPWVAAAFMWLYNLISCGLPNWAPAFEHLYPYTTDRATFVAEAAQQPSRVSLNFEGRVLRVDRRVATPAPTMVTLAKPIPLRKWDTEPTTAPWSFWLARAWTLLYYGVLPFLLTDLLVLVWGATNFIRAGKRWADTQPAETSGFNVNPYESDGYGGLSALSGTALGYLYAVSIFFLLLGLSFLKENAQPSWHDYALMLLFIPAATSLVFVPTFAVRSVILYAKGRYLQSIAARMKANADTMLADDTATTDSEKAAKEQATLRELYKDIGKMTEWPFDAHSLIRIFLAVAAPWMPAALKEIMSGLFGH